MKQCPHHAELYHSMLYLPVTHRVSVKLGMVQAWIDPFCCDSSWSVRFPLTSTISAGIASGQN